jgi:hypothetical protein
MIHTADFIKQYEYLFQTDQVNFNVFIKFILNYTINFYLENEVPILKGEFSSEIKIYIKLSGLMIFF